MGFWRCSEGVSGCSEGVWGSSGHPACSEGRGWGEFKVLFKAEVAGSCAVWGALQGCPDLPSLCCVGRSFLSVPVTRWRCCQGSQSCLSLGVWWLFSGWCSSQSGLTGPAVSQEDQQWPRQFCCDDFLLESRAPLLLVGNCRDERHSFSSLGPGFWLCLCGSWSSSLHWGWQQGRKGSVWWITRGTGAGHTGLCCWLSSVPLSASGQSHSLGQGVVALPGLALGVTPGWGGRYPPHSAALCCILSTGSQLNTQSSNISSPRVGCPTPEMPWNGSCLALWPQCALVLFVSDTCTAGQAEIVHTWRVCGLIKPLWGSDKELQTPLHWIYTSRTSWARLNPLLPVGAASLRS